VIRDPAVCSHSLKVPCNDAVKQYTLCPEKKTKTFWYYLLQNCGDSSEMWCIVSRINLLKKSRKPFPLHLNSFSACTLYLAKFGSAHRACATSELSNKLTPNLSHLDCGLQIRQIWIHFITACVNIAREGVQNTHHWSGAINDTIGEWLPPWVSWRHDAAWPTPFSVAVSVRPVISVLNIFSCNIFHTL